MQTQVGVKKTIGASSDEVWKAIRGIGGLDRWFPIIESCHVAGDGVGAIRTLTLAGGGEIVDVIEAIDDSRRRLCYRRTKHPFPVRQYRGVVEAQPEGEGTNAVSCTVSWTVTIDVEDTDRDAVTTLLRQALSDGLDGLARELS